MRKFIKNVRLLWPYIKSAKFNIIKCILCNIISIVFKIIVPILLAKVIISITNDELVRLLQIAVVIFGVGIIDNFVRGYSHKYSQKIRKTGMINLQKRLSREILKISQGTLNKKGSGFFINSLTEDADEVTNVVGNINYDLSNFIRYLGTFLAVLYINVYVFIFLIVRYMITVYLEKVRTDVKKTNNRKYKESSDKFSSLITEFIRGISDIKMLNAERSFLKVLNDENTNKSELNYKMTNSNENYFILNDSISDILQLLFYFLLFTLLVNKSIIAATALILINYAEILENATYTISDLMDKFKDFDIACDRLFPLINGQEFDKEKYGNKHIFNIKGDIEFKNVSFKYTNKNILDNLSFKVKSNQIIGIVGKSGAGKTTIFNLLSKLYDIDNGEILIDNNNINELDKNSIRNNITIISQNPYLFNMSIKDNFKLIKEDVSDDEIKDACKKACIDEYIMGLPEQYDT